MNNSFITRKILLAICLMAFSLLVAHCGTKKKITKESPTTKTEENNPPKINNDYALLKNILIQFKTFEGRAGVDFKSPELEQSGDLVIKMKSAKESWASVRGLGGLFEVAQAFANRDSMYAIQRLTRSYYALSFAEGAQLIHIPLDFDMLQQFIIGNPVIIPTESQINFNNGKLFGEKIAAYSYSDFNINLEYYPDKKELRKQIITRQSNRNESIICTYANYQIIKNQKIPLKRTIVAQQGNATYSITLNFNTVKLNEGVDYTFNFQKK